MTYPITQADLVTDKRKLDLLRKKRQLEDDAGVDLYEPSEWQDKFHRASWAKYRFVRAANRTGKSYAQAAECIAWLMGERSWYPEDDPARYEGIPKRPVKGVLVCEDWGKAESVFTAEEGGDGRGKFFRLIPKRAFLGTAKGHQGRIEKFLVKSKWGGTSSLTFETVQSFKQNSMSVESDDWDFAGFDEPLPEQMFKGISRGFVDRGGKCWFLLTPLSEPWINDFFFPDSKKSKELRKLEPHINEKRWVISAEMWDNPYNDPEDIADFLDTLTKDERACREKGIPMSYSGLIYKEFDSDRHIYQKVPHGWDDFGDPPKDYPIRFAFDYHPSARSDQAVLFSAVAPTGQVYFFQEIFDKLYIPELIERIQSIIEGRFLVAAVADPLAFIPDPEDGSCIAESFHRAGVAVDKAVKDPGFGRMQVQTLLKDPRALRFSPYLDETLHEIERWSWDDKRRKPVDKDDHQMENLYRLVLLGTDYCKPPEVEEWSSLGRSRALDAPNLVLRPTPLDLNNPSLNGRRRGRQRRNKDSRYPVQGPAEMEKIREMSRY